MVFKRNHIKVGVIFALVVCLTFLGAVFVAPPIAEAAFTAAVAQSNYVPRTDLTATPPIPNQNLGYFKVEVNVADWSTAIGSQLFIAIPTKLAMVAPNVSLSNTFAGGNGDIRVVLPASADNAFKQGAGVADGITVAPAQAKSGAFFVIINQNVAAATKDKGWFYVHLNNIDTSNFVGDVNVTLVPQAGTAFGTTPVPLVVGKVNVIGTTTTAPKSITKISSNGGLIDTIAIFENVPGTITAPGTVSLEIVTDGYVWNTTGATANGLFSFSAGATTFGAFVGNGTNTVTLPVFTVPGGGTSAGAIAISGLRITIGKNVANFTQDIEVKVSGAGVTKQFITVAELVAISQEEALIGFDKELLSRYKSVLPTKRWNIKCNLELDGDTVNKTNVYILDKDFERVPIQYEISANVIELIPVNPYLAGQEYILFVRDLKSKTGDKLKDNVFMRFTAKESGT